LAGSQKELKGKVRFSSETVRTDVGGRIDAAGGDETGDMYADPGLAAGIEAVLKRGIGVYCESSNIYWIAKTDGDLPSDEIHMILSGQRHEFALTKSNSKTDYEWVLNQLRALA
jgi:hypothetical protein